MYPLLNAGMAGLLFILVGVFSQALFAAAICEVGEFTSYDQAVDVFASLYESDCLGGQQCTAELCVKVSNWEKSWQDDTQYAAVLTEAAALMAEIRNQSGSLADKNLAQALRKHTGSWVGLIAAGKVTDYAKEDLFPKVLEPQDLILFQASDEQTDIEADLRLPCSESVERCQTAFELYSEVYSLSLLSHRLLHRLLQNQRRATVAYLEQLDARWESYFTNSRALFPWEIGVNSYFERDRLLERGFVGPPNSQILFLHPEVALQLKDSDQNNQLDGAIVLEIIGRYWWEWGGKNKTEVESAKGISLALSWTGDDKAYYGVMTHWPGNWSAGVMASADGDLSLLVSTDLGKLFLDSREYRSKLIKMLKN